MRVVELVESPQKNKKYRVKIETDGGSIKTIHFGQKGASDYTIHKDADRRKNYIARHSKEAERWKDPLTPSFWSRWLLWEHDDFDVALREINDKLEKMRNNNNNLN
jgi:hypothetical protein